MRKIISYLFLLLPAALHAGEADVIAANVEPMGGNYFRIEVTVRHKDEDWDHYVKSWEVVDMDGKTLGVRALRHPHVNEQPFTRAATVFIPAAIDKVVVRAYDSVHGTGGNELMLYINRDINDETN